MREVRAGHGSRLGLITPRPGCWRRRAAGKLTGDGKLKAEGKTDKAAGTVQSAVGGLKNTLRGK